MGSCAIEGDILSLNHRFAKKGVGNSDLLFLLHKDVFVIIGHIGRYFLVTIIWSKLKNAFQTHLSNYHVSMHHGCLRLIYDDYINMSWLSPYQSNQNSAVKIPIFLVL